MKSLKMILVVAVASGLVGRAAARVDVSETLTSYNLKSLDGANTKLSSFKGDVVVVNFWASWCAPCLKELPVMNKWHAAWSERGARVVAISVDEDVRKARRFANKADLTLTVLHDGPSGLAKTLDLPSLPCTFLLDREGNVVKVIRSSSSEDLAALKQAVEALLQSPRKSSAREPNAELSTATSSADGETP